jgi:hypothetical protein
MGNLFSQIKLNMKNKDLNKQFNIPTWVSGDSPSDEAKSIKKRFADRKDKASIDTMESLLQSVADKQEYIKEMNKSPEQKQQEQMQMQQQQMQSQPQQPQQGGQPQFQPQMPGQQPNQMAEGGFANFMDQNGEALGAAAGAGTFEGALSGGLALGANALLPGSGALVDPLIQGAKSLFGIGKGAEVKKAGIATQGHANSINNTFGYGGSVNKYRLGGPFDIMENIPSDDAEPSVDMINIEGNADMKAEDDRLSIDYANILKQDGIDKQDKKDKFSNLINKGMRLAPLASNVLQMKNLKKPEYESLDRLDNRYQKQLVDEMQLQNQVSNQGNATAEAIANSSVGNTSSLRAGLLGKNLNKVITTGNNAANTRNFQSNENAKAQQFNVATDRTNLQQSNAENDINARNKGAYETEKSKLLAKFGDNIGAVGKEGLSGQRIAKALGYTVDGEYLIGKDGKKIMTIKEAQKMIEANKNS